MFSIQDKKKLLKLARDSISEVFSENIAAIPQDYRFLQKQGVFVTLKKNNELRGCIGFPEAIYPLNKAISIAAKAAAFEDYRFDPLSEKEFSQIKIEISVLTVPQELKADNPDDYKDKIKIGKDGLIIKHPHGSGLLLPQVPIEWKWDSIQFLKQICNKAGLPENFWKDKTAKLYTFQAEIFSEDE
jgi:AmmeMemoRadiSam system protein A